MIAVIAASLITAGFALTAFGLVGGWLSARRAVDSQERQRASSRAVTKLFEVAQKELRASGQVAETVELGNTMNALEQAVRKEVEFPDTSWGAADFTGEGAKVESLRVIFDGVRWDLAWLGSGILLTYLGSMVTFFS